MRDPMLLSDARRGVVGGECHLQGEVLVLAKPVVVLAKPVVVLAKPVVVVVPVCVWCVQTGQLTEYTTTTAMSLMRAWAKHAQSVMRSVRVYFGVNSKVRGGERKNCSELSVQGGERKNYADLGVQRGERKSCLELSVEGVCVSQCWVGGEVWSDSPPLALSAAPKLRPPYVYVYGELTRGLVRLRGRSLVGPRAGHVHSPVLASAAAGRPRRGLFAWIRSSLPLGSSCFELQLQL